MSSILDPGKASRDAAAAAAGSAQFDTVSGGGAFGGGTFSDGQFTGDLGQFGGLFGNIMSGLGGVDFSGGTPGGAMGLQALQDAAAGSTGDLGALQFGQAGQFQAPQQQQFQPGLQQNLFANAQQQLDILGQTPQALGAQKAQLLTQLAAPGEARARQGLEQNLFAQGRGGTSGGALQTQALAEAQSQADLQRQLAGLEFGRATRADALGQLQGTIGQGLGLSQQGQALNAQNFQQALAGGQFNEALRQGQFGRDIGAQSLAGQRALDRFGIASGLFGQQQQAAQQGALLPFQQLQAGLGSLGQIQGFGLNQFNQALQAQIAQSNAALGSAGIHSQNAANASSPLMDLASGVLGAAGSAGGFGALFSDRNLKDNIKRIGTLGDFNWYEWTWNKFAEMVGADKEPNYGVIAQEVEKLRPDAVSKGPMGYRRVNYGVLYNG
jgi:hypothetical protein